MPYFGINVDDAMEISEKFVIWGETCVTAVATPRSADVTDDTRIVARRVLVEVSFW